jgi:hypothetical protein
METPMVTTRLTLKARIVVDDSDPAAVDADRLAQRQGEAMMEERAGRACDQSSEGAMPGGSLPEHAEQKRGEQRRIDEGKDELERVHDVVEAGNGVGRADGEQNASDRRHPAHP